jgi:hypothetical protein
MQKNDSTPKVTAIRDTQVTRTVVEETVPVIHLTLPLDHAETMLRITNMVGGDPVRSRRGHADRIGRALRDAGVKETERESLTGGLYFRS